MNLIITTSNNASDEAKRLAKFLNRIIPQSNFIARGNRSISDIISKAEINNAKSIIIITSKAGKARSINFYAKKGDGYIQSPFFIRIYDFFDPKFFGGIKKLKGPVSISTEASKLDQELSELLAEYMNLKIGIITDTWLMIDVHEYSTYIQFVDQYSLKRFAMIRLKVLKYS